jgi:hypothetical protein
LLKVKAFAMGMLPAELHTTTALAQAFVLLMSNVKQREMRMTTDVLEMDLLDDSLKLCWISIYLSIGLPDASLDHERIDGGHRFSVLRDGVAYDVDFAQDALSNLDGEELLHALEQIVDRIVADAGSGPITLRSEARDLLQAA